MTLERIHEAIRAYDPDGAGLARILAEARLNALNRGCPLTSPLAVAWYQDGPVVYVTRTHCVVHGTRHQLPHEFADVMEYFDQLELPEPSEEPRYVQFNQAVCRVLEPLERLTEQL